MRIRESGLLLILFTSSVIALQGVLVLRSSVVLNITALAAFKDMDHTLVGLLLLGSASSTMMGLLRRRELERVLFLIPQQAILFALAYGPLQAIGNSAYADGVPRAWEFILGDQAVVPLAALFHTAAIFSMARR